MHGDTPGTACSCKRRTRTTELDAHDVLHRLACMRMHALAPCTREARLHHACMSVEKVRKSWIFAMKSGSARREFNED